MKILQKSKHIITYNQTEKIKIKDEIHTSDLKHQT